LDDRPGPLRTGTAAVVGVVGGAAYYNDLADVAGYVAKLETLAVYGDAVRQLLAHLAHLAAEYRAMTE
jgi:hypothetical protein